MAFLGSKLKNWGFPQLEVNYDSKLFTQQIPIIIGRNYDLFHHAGLKIVLELLKLKRFGIVMSSLLREPRAEHIRAFSSLFFSRPQCISE